VDTLAKQATVNGKKPKFKIPYTAYYVFSTRYLREKFSTFLKKDFLTKGKIYHSYFFNSPTNPNFIAYLSLEIRSSL